MASVITIVLRYFNGQYTYVTALMPWTIKLCSNVDVLELNVFNAFSSTIQYQFKGTVSRDFLYLVFFH